MFYYIITIQGGISIENIKKGDIAEIKNGFLFIGSGSRCRAVAIVNPLLVDRKTFGELGKELNYGTPESMLQNLRTHASPVKTFEMVFVQTNKRKGEQESVERLEIFGLTPRHPITEDYIVRRIGFYNPREVEKRYREFIAEEELPGEVPYWQYYKLGEEWRGTTITRESSFLKITNLGTIVGVFRPGLVFNQK